MKSDICSMIDHSITQHTMLLFKAKLFSDTKLIKIIFFGGKLLKIFPFQISSKNVLLILKISVLLFL